LLKKYLRVDDSGTRSEISGTSLKCLALWRVLSSPFFFNQCDLISALESELFGIASEKHLSI
jgi:hypothetical protein